MSSNPERKTGSAAVSSSPAVGDDLQANLRHLDRLANLGLVSASVAHEIKNGLVAVNTFVEVLMEKNGDEHQEMTDLVRRELKRIDQLVTQMLRHASPQAPRRTRVPVHQLLDHSLRLLEHQMNGRLIALKRDYQAQPDEVPGDESQLQQAFMNLLLNGVEAIGKNGELAVQTIIRPGEDGGRWLIIQIRDTGPGISPENLSRLFQPFFTTKKNGTGLGLAICQRVAQEHQGHIEVQSSASGSAFIVSLPVE
jgi:two-component system nitrogen regulation sensor histidine kinase GlnL